MATRRIKGEGSVYQRADGRWIGAATVGYTESGRQKRKTVSDSSAQGARKKLKGVMSLLDEGLPPPDDKVSVAQLLERWLNDALRHQVAPSAFNNYEWAVRIHIAPDIGNKKVSKLTVHDVDHLISKKMDAGLAPSSVRRIRSVLIMGLDQGVKWGYVARNVAKLTKGPKVVFKEGRSLTPAQAQKLLKSTAGHRFETLYVVTLALGLRRGEVLGIKWTDIDFAKRKLTISRQLQRVNGKLVLGDVKTVKSHRSLNLTEPVVEHLKAHKARQSQERLLAGECWQDNGLVFTTEIGTPFDPRNLHRDFGKLSENAGIGKWHPHELRHSFASLLLESGVAIEVVSELLGHASIRITADTYGHIGEPQREKAADAMAKILWEPSGVNA
jgi:integrase